MFCLSVLAVVDGLDETEKGRLCGFHERATDFARLLPLVRVVVPEETAENQKRREDELREVFDCGLLRTTHKSSRSEEKERMLGGLDGVYFHSGRTHPDYGVAAFMISELPSSFQQEASPFGLGGLLCGGSTDSMHSTGGCVSPIAHEDLRVQVDYVKDNNWSGDWRAHGSEFLSLYYGGTLDLYYADLDDGRPSREDPAGVYVDPANRDWRSWTIEVRVSPDVNLFDVLNQNHLLAWGVDSQLEGEMDARRVRLGASFRFLEELRRRATDRRIRDAGKGKEHIFKLMDELARKRVILP